MEVKEIILYQEEGEQNSKVGRRCRVGQKGRDKMRSRIEVQEKIINRIEGQGEDEEWDRRLGEDKELDRREGRR